MIYEKPKNEIFASDAKDGEIVEFPNVKRGWGVTENLGFIPPMEYFNATFNRVDKSLAYQLQRGVGEWDKDMEYPIGAVVSLNGIIYIAKSQNTNKNPANEAATWDIVATQRWCDDIFAPKDDLPSLATEVKPGITKLKNAITAKQEDVAVTEKAVREFVDNSQNGIGVGQTYKKVWDQRDLNTYYPNTTNKPILVCISIEANNIDTPVSVIVDEVVVLTADLDNYTNYSFSFIVPAGSKYKLATLANPSYKKSDILQEFSNEKLNTWSELS